MTWTLKTLGHASIALYRDGDAPLLLTDPWLIGSVYWRSWWLQNYPSEPELDWLARRTSTSLMNTLTISTCRRSAGWARGRSTCSRRCPRPALSATCATRVI